MPTEKKKRNIFSLFGVSYRKIAFFCVVFLCLYFAAGQISKNKYSADITPISGSLTNWTVEILENGKVLVNGKESETKIDLENKELRLKILDNPGEYLSEVTILLISPKDNAKDFAPQLVTEHGVLRESVSFKNSRTVIYEADSVSPYATVTIVAKIPEGTIYLSPLLKWKEKNSNLTDSIWLISAIVLPILTLIGMFFFLIYQHKRQKIDIPDQEITQPPMAIPPSIVGALYFQKIGSREIAATLIDLAQRGDIVIIDQERGFSFGKGRFDHRLLGFEKILLSKIFEEGEISASEKDIERRVNKHLYSKKMSAVTLGVFALATRLGYFKVNPQRALLKYYLVAVLAFLIALSGFILSIFKFTEPPYAVFFWVGMMASALIISLAVRKLPVRTIIGQEVLSNWLAFRKFLSNPEVFPFSETNQEVFQKYLPYAIVLNCEASWAKRFENHNFTVPGWFFSYRTGLGLEDFCLSLFPIVSYIGQSLTAIREPGFK